MSKELDILQQKRDALQKQYNEQSLLCGKLYDTILENIHFFDKTKCYFKKDMSKNCTRPLPVSNIVYPNPEELHSIHLLEHIVKGFPICREFSRYQAIGRKSDVSCQTVKDQLYSNVDSYVSNSTLLSQTKDKLKISQDAYEAQLSADQTKANNQIITTSQQVVEVKQGESLTQVDNTKIMLSILLFIIIVTIIIVL